ncbi:MAG: heparan-alpha-glucosaminide N-acetyltransferase domain-containing protein [Bacteroidota bacterium]
MEATLSSHSLSSSASNRLAWLDGHRGFIMIVMAIDHASALVARKHPSEFWGVDMHVYDSGIAFLTRFITHICAPGFFLLMGMGIFFLEEARKKKGWTEGKITSHLAIRGGILLILQHIIENPAWILGFSFASPNVPQAVSPPGVLGPPMFVFGVITSLGLSMICLSIFRRLHWQAILALGVAVIVLSQLIVPGEENINVGYSFFARITAIPGMTAPVMVMYPLIPWLGVALIGYVFAKWIQNDEKQAIQFSLPIGLGLIAIFFLIRIIGEFGNTHPFQSGDWMAFMNVTKYPPSIAYISWTLGLNFLILYAFYALGKNLHERSPLIVFGQSALFFYVIHLYLYAIIGSAFPDGTSFLIMYVLWAAGLLLLYPICQRYGRFKRTTAPGSVWRML